ncbi:MAG TPA: hypothetical protein VLJ10_05225 [Candidatus Bathyarchaeia archaeon]|nr:hypothetical protein [Candidatus Bathyarchaeia archaeon]
MFMQSGEKYLHAFVIKEELDVMSALKALAEKSGFKLMNLTEEQRDWLNKVCHPAIFWGEGRYPVPWKMYRIIRHEKHFYIFPFHRDSYIDSDFHSEAVFLSRYLKARIHYFWEEHATDGLEIFNNGETGKKITQDTHGPGTELDGREIPYDPNLLKEYFENEGLVHISPSPGKDELMFFLKEGLSGEDFERLRKMTDAQIRKDRFIKKFVLILVLLLAFFIIVFKR